MQKAKYYLFYRPHPGENRKEVKKIIPDDIHLTPKTESLTRCFNKYDIFFSITSTALVEAALRGKICAQIFVESLPMDKFQDLVVCYTLSNSSKKIEEFLSEVLKGTKLPFEVSSKYIYCPDNLAERFLDIIEDIRVKWEKGDKNRG